MVPSFAGAVVRALYLIADLITTAIVGVAIWI